MKKMDKQKVATRLEYIQADLANWIEDNRVQFWNEKLSNVDNFSWGLLCMQDYFVMQLMTYWYLKKDIHCIKNYAYNYAKLQYVIAQPPYDYLGQEYAFEKRAFCGLWFLLSNHKPLIEWYAHFDRIFSKTADSLKNEQFFTKQFFIALRGDWELLQIRCEQILAEPPTSGRGKNYLIDHAFYLALAQGNTGGMVNAISQLLETKTFNRRQRMDLESGYTKDLIDTPATLYTKLAWYHGYQIQIESDYIPQEWLDMTPLTCYQDEFDFMKEYLI